MQDETSDQKLCEKNKRIEQGFHGTAKNPDRDGMVCGLPGFNTGSTILTKHGARRSTHSAVEGQKGNQGEKTLHDIVTQENE